MDINNIHKTFSSSVRGHIVLVDPAWNSWKKSWNSWTDQAESISILPGARGVRSVNQVNILCSLSNGCWALSLVKTNLWCALPLSTHWSSLEGDCGWGLTITALSIKYACNNYIQWLDRELCITGMKFAETYSINRQLLFLFTLRWSMRMKKKLDKN